MLVLEDRGGFVAGSTGADLLLASVKTVTDEGDTILLAANAGPSQIAGELCNKNYFSTSWNNDQTPMAMGEYLNKLESKKAGDAKVIAALRDLKNLHRNPLAHPEQSLDTIDDAVALLGGIQALVVPMLKAIPVPVAGA